MIFLSPPHLLLVSLLLTTSSLHGLPKKKRSISDLKNDSLLSKVFSSDVKKEEKKERPDRSINIQDEQETNHKVQAPQPAAFVSGYYGGYPYYQAPTAAPVMERRAINLRMEPNSQYITEPYPSVDLIPAKRNFIPHPENPSGKQGVKKSTIPLTPEVSSKVVDSFPLHLNVRSPNVKLQGVVPHFEEYGETVESVMKAQRAQKRFMIPRPEYSSEIVKKSDIPHPDDDEQQEDDSSLYEKPSSEEEMTKPRRKASNKRSKVQQAKKRQYLQYPQQQMQQFTASYNNPANPYANNFMNSGSFFTGQQNGMLSYQQPQQVANQVAAISSHVQNLDGRVAKPLTSSKACDDQFALCSEYAKNDYCTNYRPQMEVQCRKSCGFCSPQAVARSNDDEGSGGSGEVSGSGESEPVKASASVTGSKRHDILQERANIRQPESEESGDGSGSESGSGDGSASGSGESEQVVSDVAPAPVEATAPVFRNPQQEFHLPGVAKKDEAPDVQSDSDDDSGSGSGSGDESGDSQDNEKPVAAPVAPAPVKEIKKLFANTVTKKAAVTQQKSKRTKIPKRPGTPMFYPRIDLKAIASSLAHYEEAALELAGEYPKLQDTDVTEYTRSFIPHPESTEEIRANRNRQNIQIAKIISSERARKDNIPKFLKVTSDVKKSEGDHSKDDADSLDQVQQRFTVPGVEPTLNDYYAETGKLNPFAKKISSKNYKKSRIENAVFSNHGAYDPYQYLRDMPAGASMEPIIDPRKRSQIPSDHSYPVFLMKVSPSDEDKYLEEKGDKRGKIRHYNAEGVEMSDETYQKSLHAGPNRGLEAARPATEPAVARSNAPPAPVARPDIPSFTIADKRTQQPQVPQQLYPAAPPAPVVPQQPASSMFPNMQQFQYEPQPGANNLRSKMLNAFFDTRTNSSPEEGSGMASSGDGRMG